MVPPVRAQTHEWQVQALGTFAAARFAGAGVGHGWRLPGRVMVVISANGGAWDGKMAVRAEGLATYHLYTPRRRGVSPYAGGGVAFVARSGASAEYLVVVLGAETASPVRRIGWFLEVGIGGGVRASAGMRLRRPPRR
jgi:hypothetical protein